MRDGDPTDDFVLYWRGLDVSQSVLVHPKDAPFLTSNERFDLSLMPLPIVGDLRRADVIILMLNPGLNDSDDCWERDDLRFRATLERNLLQDASDSEYPFFYLDPQFAGHPGADYWYGDATESGAPKRRRQQKLRRLAHRLARDQGCPLDHARRELAQRIAILQLVPYHSRRFGSYALLKTLPSVQQAIRFVERVRSERLIIAIRAARHWGLQCPSESADLIVYPRVLATSASLTPESPGGAAILQRLLSKPSTLCVR